MNQDHSRFQKILSGFEPDQENLLPILHAIQDAYGYIPAESTQPIALKLNISQAEVYGVVSYYRHFRTAPIAKNHLQICRAEACRSMGAEDLYAHAVDLCANQSASDQSSVTVEAIYCLGLCATSPALMLNEKPHGRVTPDSLSHIIRQARGNKS